MTAAIYMHPRLAITAFERLATYMGMGVTADQRGNILLSANPLAYRPRTNQEIVDEFLNTLLREIKP